MNRKPNAQAVLFKNPNVYLSAETIEEGEDYVNAVERTADKNPNFSDEKTPSFSPSFPLVSVCWLIFLVIMALRFYFTSLISDNMAKLRENQTAAAAANQNVLCLSSANDSLRRVLSDQTVLIGDLRQNNSILTSESQQLQMEKSALERQVEKLRRERTELSLTWILDAYCPKTGDKEERRCNPCQEGWLLSPSNSSCYLVVHSTYSDWKTWEEAAEDCRQRNADLVVIENRQEQEFIRGISSGPSDSSSYSYWIGLRRTSGVWKWVDGSELTESYWINQPYDNKDCAASVQWTSPKGWIAGNCPGKNRWICEMKALSV